MFTYDGKISSCQPMVPRGAGGTFEAIPRVRKVFNSYFELQISVLNPNPSGL